MASEPPSRLGAETEVAGGVGQFAHLACGGFEDALVAVAGVDTPEPGEAVDQLVARRIGDGRPGRRFQHPDACGLMAAIGGNRMHQMGAVEFDERIAEHDLLRFSRMPDWRVRR